jgi:hypothetical protein
MPGIINIIAEPETDLSTNLLFAGMPQGFGISGSLIAQSAGPDSKGLINQSGYDYNKPKMLNKPPGWVEIEPYGETWEDDNNTVYRTFAGPWGDRKLFIDWVLGFSWNDNGTLRRVVPAHHPEYYWLFAVGVDQVEGRGAIIDNPNVFVTDPGGGLTGPLPVQERPMIAYYDTATNSDFLCCRLRVTYKALPYEIRTDLQMRDNGLSEINRWVERQETYAIRTLAVPGYYLQFPGNPPVPIPENAGNKLTLLKELTYIWRDVPDVPEAAIKACLNRTNNAAFDPPVQINGVNVGGTDIGGYPPGTLLFNGVDRKRKRSKTGRVLWDLIYKFLYQDNGTPGSPAGWNYFPMVQTDNNNNITGFQFAQAFLPGGGGLQYPPNDFTQLFTQPSPPTLYLGPNG